MAGFLVARVRPGFRPDESRIGMLTRHRSPAVKSEQAPLMERFGAEQAGRAYR
jgi:hypothetical protein